MSELGEKIVDAIMVSLAMELEMLASDEWDTTREELLQITERLLLAEKGQP